MNIFESLENLNVSEECFDEIMGIVEEILGESKVLAYSHEQRAKNDASNAQYGRPSVHPREKGDKIIAKARQLDKKLYDKMVTDLESSNSKVKGEAERRKESLNTNYNGYRADKQYSDKKQVRPDYQHYKNIGTKAVKGHYFDNTHNLVEDPGKKLYRIGKSLEKRNK